MLCDDVYVEVGSETKKLICFPKMLCGSFCVSIVVASARSRKLIEARRRDLEEIVVRAKCSMVGNRGRHHHVLCTWLRFEVSSFCGNHPLDISLKIFHLQPHTIC